MCQVLALIGLSSCSIIRLHSRGCRYEDRPVLFEFLVTDAWGGDMVHKLGGDAGNELGGVAHELGGNVANKQGGSA